MWCTLKMSPPLLRLLLQVSLAWMMKPISNPNTHCTSQAHPHFKAQAAPIALWILLSDWFVLRSLVEILLTATTLQMLVDNQCQFGSAYTTGWSICRTQNEHASLCSFLLAEMKTSSRCLGSLEGACKDFPRPYPCWQPLHMEHTGLVACRKAGVLIIILHSERQHQFQDNYLYRHAGTLVQQSEGEGGGIQHTYVCKQSRTVGHTVASCSVGKVAELQLVDSPALPADVHSDIHSQCTP